MVEGFVLPMAFSAVSAPLLSAFPVRVPSPQPEATTHHMQMTHSAHTVAVPPYLMVAIPVAGFTAGVFMLLANLAERKAEAGHRWERN